MKLTKDKLDGIIFKFFLASFIVLIAINISLQGIITSMDGDAKLINSLGLIRGSSQRLTKQEFFGDHSDEHIKFIDDVIEELMFENGKEELATFSDKKYKNEVVGLSEKWDIMKKEIYSYRKTNDKTNLYNASEDFFESADNLTYISEQLTQEKVSEVINLKIIFWCFTLITIIVFVVQMYFTVMLRKNLQTLVTLAKKDKLTGLPNRRACDEQIEKYSTMPELSSLCCISIDLDNLKKLNDNYGHFVGDRVLALFGNSLIEETKEGMFSCRNGGDEFMVFIEDCDMEKAENFIKDLDKNVAIKNSREKLVHISYSYGIALSSEDSKYTINTLINIADKRMYDLKSTRKK